MNEKLDNYDDWEEIYNKLGNVYSERLIEETESITNGDEDLSEVDEWFHQNYVLTNTQNSITKISFVNIFSRFATVILLFTILGFVGVYSSVEAFRVEINSLFIQVEEEYILLEHRDLLDIQDENVYLLTIIPDDFTLKYIKQEDDVITMNYVTEENSYIIFTQTPHKLVTKVSIKDSTLEHMLINGEEGVVIKSDFKTILYWSDETKNYTLESNISENILLQVASSIYRVK